MIPVLLALMEAAKAMLVLRLVATHCGQQASHQVFSRRRTHGPHVCLSVFMKLDCEGSALPICVLPAIVAFSTETLIFT